MTTSHPPIEKIAEDLEDILVRAAGVDPAALTPGGPSSLEELGMDSLAAMELQAVVKSEYDVALPDELLDRSVPEIAELIRSALPGRD